MPQKIIFEQQKDFVGIGLRRRSVAALQRCAGISRAGAFGY